MRAPRKRRAGVFRRLVGALGLFVLFGIIAIGSLLAFLREDRITGIARDQIARLAGDGYETDLAKASVSLFNNGVAGIEIDNISIRDAQSQRPLIQRGKASFSVSLVSLLFGKIEFTELSLIDAEMHLGIGFGTGPTLIENLKGSDGLIDPKLAAVLLDRAANSISGRLFANPDLKINANNTKLIFGGREPPATILIETLVASKSISDEFAFSAVLSNSNWTSNLTGAFASSPSASGKNPYRMTLSPIPFSRSFEPQLPDSQPRNCSGQAGFAVASANGQTSIDVSLIKTICEFGQLGNYALDATIKGNLKRDSGVFEIGRGVVNVNRSVFNFEGAIAPARYTPQPENSGETARYRYELVFSPSKMDSLDNVEGPLPVEGKISGTFAPSENRLAFDEFIVDAQGFTLNGAASLLFGDVTPALYLALTSDKLPVNVLNRIWPRFAAPVTRRLVSDRVTVGMLRNLRLELRLPPGKIGTSGYLNREQLSGSGTFEGASLKTFGQLPPIDDGKGRVSFDGKSLSVDLEKGSASLPSGGAVNLAASSFVIADTHMKPTQARLTVALSGATDAVAEIAALQPINAFANQEISPQDFSGKASAQADLLLTLVPAGQKAPTPKYQIDVALSDLSISKAIKGQSIRKASGTLSANNQSVDVKLDAELGGIPAKITISEPRGAPEKRKQEVVLTIAETVRDLIAPELKPFLSGPITARVNGNGNTADVELDLTKATIRILPFNWQKGAGIGAKVNFSVSENGSVVSVSNLEISGRGLQASGKIQISEGAVQSAELNKVRLNPNDSFSVSLKKEGQNYAVKLGGDQLDARSIMKQILPGQQPRKGKPPQALNVTGKIGRLVGFNDEAVINAEFRLSPGKNAALSLSGSFENGGAVDFARKGGQDGQMIVNTDNAGAALRFVDLYKRMIGGALAADFKVGEFGGMSGPISISNFSVIGEPRLAQLVSEQAPGSTSLAAATKADLAGKQAKFELAQGNVVLDNGTIRLKSGIVRGVNVGATAEGIVLSAGGQMDLRGTFMPARGLNRIVGAIPILGLFLGSGSNAGLIGITYQLAGDAKNPKVFVNPISMIAPGVFRQIFE